MEFTIDGHKPEPGERITLYSQFGTPIAGEPHHYGSERGWQIQQRGLHISELYFDRLNALKARRAEVAAMLAAIDDEIRAITPARRRCDNPDCAQCSF